jgi:hypothetical protein
MHLRVDEGMPNHRKTVQLARLVKNPDAGMCMIRLWAWACRSSPGGSLAGLEAADVEAIAQFRGTPGTLWAAMVAVGFVDDAGLDMRAIHDWMDWTGRDVEDMAEDAKRKWWWRRHSANPQRCGKLDGLSGQDGLCPFCERESTDRPRTVHGTSTVARPDQARPGQTRPDQKEDQKGPRESARPPKLFDLVLGDFQKMWKSKYHETYVPTAKDKSQLGRLLQDLKSPETAAALPAYFAAYLGDRDPFVAEKQRHSLAFFCTSGGLNKYRTTNGSTPTAPSRGRAAPSTNHAKGEVKL